MIASKLRKSLRDLKGSNLLPLQEGSKEEVMLRKDFFKLGLLGEIELEAHQAGPESLGQKYWEVGGCHVLLIRCHRTRSGALCKCSHTLHSPLQIKSCRSIEKAQIPGPHRPFQ